MLVMFEAACSYSAVKEEEVTTASSQVRLTAAASLTKLGWCLISAWWPTTKWFPKTSSSTHFVEAASGFRRVQKEDLWLGLDSGL